MTISQTLTFRSFALHLGGGLLLGVSLLLTGAVAAQPALSMRDAVEATLHDNAEVHQYERIAEQKSYERRAALSNYLPDLSLSAAYTRLKDPLAISLDPLRAALIDLQSRAQAQFANLQSVLQQGRPLTEAEQAAAMNQASQVLGSRLPAFESQFKDQAYPSAALTLVQPVFTGGKITAGARAARAEEDAARFSLQRTENEAVQTTIDRYLSVVFLRDVVAARERVLAGMQQHRDRADKLRREGLIPQSDVMRADVAVAGARRSLTDDLRRADLARTALLYAMGTPDADATIQADTLAYFPVEASEQHFVDLALDRQPALAMLASKERAAHQKVAAERAEFFPQVALFGRYELFPDYLSVTEPEWAVGARVQMNLFGGFERSGRLKAARAQEDAVRDLQEHTERQIALLVRQSYGDMRRAETAYLALAADLTLATENLRMAERRYETGLGTSLDVIDAQLLLEKQEVERLQALYDYHQAMNRLFTAAGRPLDMLNVWNHSLQPTR